MNISIEEFCNQQVLFDHQIIDTINCILQVTVIMRCDLTKVGKYVKIIYEMIVHVL